MTARSLLQQAKKLKPKQRARLAEAIWESVEAAWTDPEMPEWHKKILEQRLKEHRENPNATIPWRDVKKRLNRAEFRSRQK